MSDRATYVLVDGENIDATLGSQILGSRPQPDERPRWDRLIAFTEDTWGQPATGLFFLAASAAPDAVRPSAQRDGFRRRAAGRRTRREDRRHRHPAHACGAVARDADVMLVSNDGDFLEDVDPLWGRRVPPCSQFRSSATSGSPFDAGRSSRPRVRRKAFDARLPRIRVIPIEEFDPATSSDRSGQARMGDLARGDRIAAAFCIGSTRDHACAAPDHPCRHRRDGRRHQPRHRPRPQGAAASVRARSHHRGAHRASRAPGAASRGRGARLQRSRRSSAPEAPQGRLVRLRARLARSQGTLGKGLLALLSRSTLDDDAWEELEDTLLAADVGVAATDELVANLRTRVRVEGIDDPAAAKAALREELVGLVDPTYDRTLDSTGARRQARRRPGRRRQRHRQDHDRRQAGPRPGRRGQDRRARRRRHVPRRRGRPAADLGRARRRADRARPRGRRPGERRLRGRAARHRRRHRRRPGRHGRPAAHQGRPDGRARQGQAGHREAGAGRRGAARHRRHHGPERPDAGPGVRRGRRRHRASC